MTTPSKILWGEGLFLRPQHFQQQDAYHEFRAREALVIAQPFGWGLRNLEIDMDALAAGIVRINRISVVLPDGETYRAPAPDSLPAPVSLDGMELPGGETVIHLAVHLLRENGNNYPVVGREAEASRFLVEHRQTSDLFTDAADAEVAVLRVAASLKPEHEPRDQFASLPLLRIRKTVTGSYEADSSFMAPTLTVSASPPLSIMLRSMLDTLQAKVNALYGFHREPSKNVIEFRSGDIASFWLLHTASSAFAALSHFHHNPQLHPERLFQELLRLAGALMTFSKSYTLSNLPSYVHDDPGPAFRRLDHVLRELLETVISTRYFSISLTETKPSFFIGRLESERITEETTFYLGVTASQPASEIVESVPLRLKVGAPDDVEKLVLSAMAGIQLTHAPQVPPAIPVRPGACYFSLDAHGPLYERMLKSQSITLYVPTGFKDISLELIAVNS